MARIQGRQLLALLKKNFIIFRRDLCINIARCLILPVLYILFVSEGQLLFQSAGHYGVGQQYRPLRNVSDAVKGMRLVFWDQSNRPEVASKLESFVTQGIVETQIYHVKNRSQLTSLCPQNFNQVSGCYGAVVWQMLAPEANNFTYQLRLDSGALVTDVKSGGSSLQMRHLPLQWAVDAAIFQYTFGPGGVPPTPLEVSYTQITQAERNDNLRLSFIRGIRQITALAFFLAFIGVAYHLTGLVAAERESQTAQLMEIMGVNTWIRLFSWQTSLTIYYAPGWLLSGVIVAKLVFVHSNKALVVLFHLVFGVSFISWSLFAATWFRRAQMSGIAVSLAAVVLAILAMVGKDSVGPVGVALLALIFQPMTFTFAYVIFANFERDSIAVNLLSSHDLQNGTMIAILFIMVVQIPLFMFLAALADASLYSGSLRFRAYPQRRRGTVSAAPELSLEGLSRKYSPPLFRKGKSLMAIEHLSLTVPAGEIVCLLGPNGCGKSTTLNVIAGLLAPTCGRVLLDSLDLKQQSIYPGTISFCPQRNVLFDELTVRETIAIWSSLKGEVWTNQQIDELIERCDLRRKSNAQAKVLSGGMKRKLQLAIAYCGHSRLVLIDEVSSGVDPLARRKLHDIMLSFRESKTQLVTTHFLDEADLLADRIAILSRGKLHAEGTSVGLKKQFGHGFTLRVVGNLQAPLDASRILERIRPLAPVVELRSRSEAALELKLSEATGLTVSSVIHILDAHAEDLNIHQVDVAGTTLDDVFLTILRDEQRLASASETVEDSQSVEYLNMFAGGKQSHINHVASSPGLSRSASTAPSVNLQSRLILSAGRSTGIREQIVSMLHKRFLVSRTNPWPQLLAVLVGVVAIGTSLVFLRNSSSRYRSSCVARSYGHPVEQLAYPFVPYAGQPVLLGPTLDTFRRPYAGSLPAVTPYIVDSGADLLSKVQAHYSELAAGGIYIDSTKQQAWLAWWLIAGLFGGMSNLNLATNVLFGNALVAHNSSLPRGAVNGFRINATYKGFDTPSYGDLGNSLKFLIFFGVSACVVYAFAALYPTAERLSKVKALQLSNGLRPISLHAAHFIFEVPVVLLVSALVCTLYGIIVPNTIRHIGTFFVVLVLFGLVSTLLSFVIALFGKSSLASFGLAAGLQAVYFLIYLAACLLTLTYAPALITQQWLLYEHFALSLVPLPVDSVVRAMIIGLNMFNLACIDTGGQLAKDFSNIRLYGGPILYLVLQGAGLFIFLVWYDSGKPVPWQRMRIALADTSAASEFDEDVSLEAQRIKSGDESDILQVLGVSKNFGRVAALRDVTFGAKRNQVLALLGPNSAGKTTLYSIIRGEIKPSSGDVLVAGESITSAKNAARAALGVCPQFDAMDALTVRQHLAFYARVKGVMGVHIQRDVETLITAVSLSDFADRQARDLSGGNQRKLSLAIAMIGDPRVLLIDEASSGMDIAAKRQIWDVLSRFTAERAIVLTTHSMEEAEALSHRVAIVAQRLLTIGTIERLRARFGRDTELSIIVQNNEADLEEKHEIAAVDPSCRTAIVHAVLSEQLPGTRLVLQDARNGLHLKFRVPVQHSTRTIFETIEREQSRLHIQFYDICQASLEEVFLQIVTEDRFQEDGYEV